MSGSWVDDTAANDHTDAGTVGAHQHRSVRHDLYVTAGAVFEDHGARVEQMVRHRTSSLSIPLLADRGGQVRPRRDRDGALECAEGARE